MIFGDYSEWTLQNLLIRIFVSLLLGSIIGLDRGLKHRVAGTKTNTVVCLGATLVMLTEQYIQFTYPGLANMTRMSAQVISGVGFLGVGTIIISSHQVRGLTTAASLWTCACIGLSVGIGFLDGGILITLLMLFALRILPLIEKFLSKRSCYYTVYFDIENNERIHDVLAILKTNKIQLESLEIIKPKVKGQPLSMLTSLKTKKHIPREDFLELFHELHDIGSIDIL